MAELVVTVRNKVAVGDGQRIVCDNTDYTVRFDLDSEWDALTNRTMIVAFSDHTMATPVLFTGNTATLAKIQGHDIAYIGLKAGNLHTTTAAAFMCDRSVSSIGGTVTPPTQDVWDQIIAALDEIEDELDGKQDTLTAGTNITIVGNVISATGGGGSVSRQSIEDALGEDSPNLSANDYSNTEKAAVAANTAARHTHENKGVLDGITAALVSAWTAAGTWVSTNGANVLSHLTDAVKHITAQERTAWNGKQDAISDLATIRSGAAAGATALQSVPSTYRTAAEQDAIHDSTKVDKVSGKGLSTNDYDNTEKQKNADNATAITSLNQAKVNYTDKLSQITGAMSDAEKKAACARMGAVYDGQYELIETITVAGGTHWVMRDKTPHNVSYNFKRLLAIIDYNTQNGNSDLGTQGFVKIQNTDYTLASCNLIGVSGFDAHIIINSNIVCGRVFSVIEAVRGVISNSNYRVNTSPTSIGYTACETITNYNFYLKDSANLGATITIYAVWA